MANLCPCSALDWTGEDQTRRHHSDCSEVLHFDGTIAVQFHITCEQHAVIAKALALASGMRVPGTDPKVHAEALVRICEEFIEG